MKPDRFFEMEAIRWIFLLFFVEVSKAKVGSAAALGVAKFLRIILLLIRTPFVALIKFNLDVPQILLLVYMHKL
jgi:hypothetical protein